MTALESSERPSRLATSIEVASVVISVLVALWVVVPLSPGSRTLAVVPALLALAQIFYSHYLRRETAGDLGLTLHNVDSALKLISLPTLAAAATLYWIGSRAGSVRFDDAGLLWKLLTLPFWGFLQQYILQAFIYRRIRTLFSNATLPVLISAALFALVHLPNPSLSLMTFVGALVWTSVYERAPNLYVLGLSHGVISLIAMLTLPTSMLPSFGVGYKYLNYL